MRLSISHQIKKGDEQMLWKLIKEEERKREKKK